jgi:glycosyltransferase involved in cell wall biosynthesis
VVVLAAYNEAERIAATLAALARAFPGALVWVADDGSTDATAEIARGAGARVLRSPRVIGQGAAATGAARAALEEVAASAGQAAASAGQAAASAGQAAASSGGPEGEPLFVLCDGDLGDSAVELAVLLGPLERGEADVAVAAFSRRVGGGLGLALGFARWAIHRRCGLLTTAPISGQRALRRGALEDVLPFAHGFGMEIGMTIDAVRGGHRLIEVELDLAHRATGRTLAGFAHRGRQLVDFVRVYLARGRVPRVASGRQRARA